jgi:hypothetical protein
VRSSCRCPCSVVAGRWTFPLPPWPYALPRGLSRSSDGVTPVRGFLRSRRFRADPQVLAPLRSMLPFNPGRFAPTSSLGLGRGGAASNRRLSPSVRRRAPFPLSTDPAGRPLPQALPPASVAENPSPQSRSTLVVLHHLDGFLRPEVAGLLHPAASHEVRRVSCRRPSERGTARSAVLFGLAGHFPRRASHPSKNSPRLQPFHIAVAVAPLPFPLSSSASSPGSVAGSRSRSSAGRSVDFEAFLRCRVRNALSTVAGREAPCPSVGFVPLQGPSGSA